MDRHGNEHDHGYANQDQANTCSNHGEEGEASNHHAEYHHSEDPREDHLEDTQHGISRTGW